MRKIILIVSFVIIAWALYRVSFWAPVQLDDIEIADQMVTNPGVNSRIVGWWSFELAQRVSRPVGWAVPVHRLFSMLTHVGAALALVWLAVELGLGAYPSTLAGLIFLIHPIQTAATTYIAQRFEVQSAAFMFLSAAAYVRFRRVGVINCAGSPVPLRVRLEAGGWWSAACVVFGILALLSKEAAIALPLWLLAIELIFFDGSALRSVWTWAALIVAAGFSYPLFVAFYHQIGPLTADVPWLPYVWNQGSAMFMYIERSILGAQHLYYGWPLLPALRPFMGWMIVAGFVCVAHLNYLQGNRIEALAFFTFFILLLPVTLIPLPDPFFEHRMYGAFAGVALLIGCMARWCPRLSLPIAIALVLVWSARTIQRNGEWTDGIVFLEMDRAAFPHDPQILARLSSVYWAEKNYPHAIEVGLDAWDERWRYSKYHARAHILSQAINMTRLYTIVGLRQPAEQFLQTATEMESDEPHVLVARRLFMERFERRP